MDHGEISSHLQDADEIAGCPRNQQWIKNIVEAEKFLGPCYLEGIYKGLNEKIKHEELQEWQKRFKEKFNP